jgi:uncharacterized repeat protein (TIGR01451 family)
MRKNERIVRRKDSVTSVALVVLAVSVLLYVEPATRGASSGTTVDVFTQKPLFNGAGPNQPSDMFGPQETVVLYALVLANGTPNMGALVTFDIEGPIPKDLEFYQTATTNSSGLAETSFSLRVINQTEVFGTWSVIATAKIDEKTYSDSLTFQVNWLIELVSVRTLDENLSNKKYFGDGGYVGFEIALRNNAMVKKTTNLEITIFDELHVPANASQIRDFLVPPGGKIDYIYGNLLIPKFAVPGNSTITVSALDEYNASYCPRVSADFVITIYGQLFPNFVDAFVYIEASPATAQPGDNITITLLVRNEGTVTLNNLSVSVRVDASILYSNVTDSLNPYGNRTTYLSLDTRGFSEGIHNITAEVQTLENEADLSDNTYSCTVELMAAKPIHDIGVVSVTCSQEEVYQGDVLNITVTVKNNGNATESTNVSAYYDSLLIQARRMIELAPGDERSYIFQWNTTNVQEGAYSISGVADPVEGETNVADNVYHDGIVSVKLRVTQLIHDVAITALSASPNETEAGFPISVKTTVKNLGKVSESFSVNLFYDNFPITALTVDLLEPGAEQNLTFVWDTSSLMEGNYTIKANIPPLPEEVNITNNRYTDGTVWIKAPKHPAFAMIKLTFLLFIFIVAMIGSLILLFFLGYSRRRRKRKRLNPFFIVIAHLHI